MFNQLEAGVGIEPAYGFAVRCMATLPPRHDLESKKGSAAAPLSTKLGAGNESRTRDLNLGKANGAPNHTATRLDVTKNCTEWLYDFMDFRTPPCARDAQFADDRH